MKISELLEQQIILESEHLKIYTALLPLYMLEDDGGGDGGDFGGSGETYGGDSGYSVQNPGNNTPPDPSPVAPSPVPTSNDAPVTQPVYYTPYGPIIGTRWFSQLVNTFRVAAVAKNVEKRMKELGLKGEGVKRVKAAAAQASKNLDYVIKNPASLSYRIPVWTTGGTPKKVKIKKFNEAFAEEFKRELSKIAGSDLI